MAARIAPESNVRRVSGGCSFKFQARIDHYEEGQHAGERDAGRRQRKAQPAMESHAHGARTGTPGQVRRRGGTLRLRGWFWANVPGGTRRWVAGPRRGSYGNIRHSLRTSGPQHGRDADGETPNRAGTIYTHI